MSTPLHNITIRQGATFDLTATWTDGAGDPIPLTGCEARMQIRRRYSSEDALASLTSEASGGIAIDENAGRVVVEITPAQTEALPGRMRGVYDLEVEFPTGRVVRLLQGKVYVDPEVTR